MHKGRRKGIENLAGEITRGCITDLLKKRGIDRRDIHEIVLERVGDGRGLLRRHAGVPGRLGSGKTKRSSNQDRNSPSLQILARPTCQGGLLPNGRIALDLHRQGMQFSLAEWSLRSPSGRFGSSR